MGHPAILTVDDDPGVSRAVARDLYFRLYHVTPDDPALDRVLAGAP